MRGKPTKRQLAIGLAVVLVLPIGVMLYNPFEPHYQGKTLSYWISRIEEPGEFKTSLDAIRSMGIEVEPRLIHRLQKPASPKLDKLKTRLSSWTNGRIKLLTSVDIRDRTFLAMEGIGASPATIPTVIEFLNTSDHQVHYRVASILRKAEPNITLPALTNFMNSHQDTDSVKGAFLTLEFMGESARQSLPLIESYTQNTNNYIAQYARILETKLKNTPAK
jgi:hypothetical protein